MAAGADNIWSVPAYLHYVQPDLTDQAQAEAEAVIGHKLPGDYLSLLRVQNGGYIRYELGETAHSLIKGIGPRFPSLTEFDWSYCEDEVEFPLEGLVPFDGDGHWHLCFDYRERNSDPAVTLVDVELNRQQFVADSFAAYLARLRRTVVDNFVLPGIQDVTHARSILMESLGIRFEPPTSYNGYEVQRGAIPGGNNQWVWLSPNTVPRAYMRKGDGQFTRIERFMNVSADRHPELPAGSWLMGASDESRANAAAALAAAGIAIHSLRPLIPDAADPP